MFARAVPKSCSRAVSVSSKITRDGDTPLVVSSATMRRTATWLVMSLDERLNDSLIDGGHPRMAASALSSITRVIGVISPVRSAVGMKMAGDTLPRAGLVQRARHSRARMRPSTMSITGWNTAVSSVSRSAPRSACSIESSALISARCSAEKISERERPARLAW